MAGVNNFDVRYERSHGMHTFDMVDGTNVLALSAPTWEEYLDMLEDLKNVQGYVVSPELITSPVPLTEIPGMRYIIEERAGFVRETSKANENARLLLGTATFNGQGTYNSVVAFQNGIEQGKQHKTWPSFSQDEYATFVFNGKSTPILPSNAHGLLICADFIAAAGNAIALAVGQNAIAQSKLNKLVNPNTSSLVLVSCWAVPLPHHAANLITPEQRYGGQLEKGVKALLASCVNLQEIIIVDRSIPISGVQPYNAHFRRTQT